MASVGLVTDAEWDSLARLPVRDLVELAADLALVAPAEVEGRALVEQCLPALCEWIRSHGLPVSKYDREELQNLPASQLRALGRLCGLETASVQRLIRDGMRTVNKLAKTQQYESIVMMLPMLLTAIARYVDERG